MQCKKAETEEAPLVINPQDDYFKNLMKEFGEQFTSDGTRQKKIRYCMELLKCHNESRRDIITAKFVFNAVSEAVKPHGFLGEEKNRNNKGDTVMHKICAIKDLLRFLIYRVADLMFSPTVGAKTQLLNRAQTILDRHNSKLYILIYFISF